LENRTSLLVQNLLLSPAPPSLLHRYVGVPAHRTIMELAVSGKERTDKAPPADVGIPTLSKHNPVM
jgi:hypothetical protein